MRKQSKSLIHSVVLKYVQAPRRKVAFGDGVVEVPDGKVRIVSGHVVGLLAVKVLDLLIRFPVELK